MIYFSCQNHGTSTIPQGNYSLQLSSCPCGDTHKETIEECEDSNTANGDGCSSLCLIEPGYTCPTPGQLCVHNPVCGDGKKEGTEVCDDGTQNDGEGCKSDCAD